MRAPSLLPVLALITACAPSAPSAPPLPPPPPLPPEIPSAAPIVAEAPLAIALDPAGAARIAADVTYLASPELAGRGTGDPGAVLARDFIVKRFTDLGLAPAGSVDGAGFTQEFTARVGARSSPPELAIAPPHGKAKRVDPVASRVADGSATGEASGLAVFVGHGITASAVGWDDYEKADLTGKIAVILDGVPTPPAPSRKSDAVVERNSPPANPLRDFGAVRYKLRTAREHHAAGVVIVTRGALPTPRSTPAAWASPP